MGSNPTPRTKVGPLAVVWELKKQGRKESTLASISKRLRYLAKNVDLGNPEKVKEFISNLQCSDGYKDNLIDAYSHYAKFYSIQWTKPKYMREERITRVPKEEDINKIIAHAKLKSASAYSVMRDTGLRLVELGMLRVKDIDLEGLSQEEAGQRMGVSRGTAWRLVQSARKKTTQTLTEGRPLIIVSRESYKGNPSGLM